MCRFIVILLSTFLLFPVMVSAQQRASILYGYIIEESTKLPIEQATVRLLNAKDSSMVRGVASGKDGYFSLVRVRPGNYILNISFVGYSTLYKNIKVSEKEKRIDLGTLSLDDASILLSEAVVVGKAPEVVVRNDTTEYNADSYKVTEGSVLEDLLRKMPGIEIDSDGKVTVNGKEITRIMVDGKEFFSDDPKVASKNLPAKMIDKVQVLDKKTDLEKMTGFDDGEEQMVINLTVKPGMKRGWFGNAYAGYGSENRYEANAMLNRFIGNDQFTLMGGLNNTNNMGFSDMASSMFSGMRGGIRGSAGNGITSSGNVGANFSKEFGSKLTIGGNARYSQSDNKAESTSSTQTFLPGDSISFADSRVRNNTVSHNTGFDFRLEWKPDSLTNLSFTPSFGYSSSHSSNLQDENTRINQDTLNISNSEVFSDGSGYDLNANLNFSRKLNSRGRVLTFSLSGGLSDSYNDESNYSETQYLQEDRLQTIDQRIRYDNRSFNYRAFISWVEPIGRGNFLQASYSISRQQQESLKNAFTQDPASHIYNVLDTASSRNYRNTFFNQRASLSFRSQREKYQYTIGLNIDPSYSRSENFIGDTVLSDLSRTVVNLSPMLRFHYRFSKQATLILNYNGSTSQPSMTQLQPVEDNSNPLRIVVGNPDLKPRYTNNLRLSFNKFTPERQRAMMFSLSGSYTLNDIVSKTLYDSQTGAQRTTYENVNGNYNLDARAMLNTPLRNKHFTINSTSSASFRNANSFINGEKNRGRTLTVSERAGADFRSDYLDLGVNADFRFSANTNSLQPENNLRTFNYGIGGYTTVYLPWDLKLESDITWSTNSGYADGYKQNEVLWNASLSKSFLRAKQATIRFKAYDILQQRSNISRTVSSTMIADRQYNTLTSYFMVHFIYRFNIFKGGATSSDTPRREPRHGAGGPPPHPRPAM